MELIEVTTKELAKQFIQVNVALNSSNPNYIRPLDKEINEVFDSEKNKTFRFGKVIRWVLKDDRGNLIGRIAAWLKADRLPDLAEATHLLDQLAGAAAEGDPMAEALGLIVLDLQQAREAADAGDTESAGRLAACAVVLCGVLSEGGTDD